MTNNEKQARKYINWINDNYQSQKEKLIAFCNDKSYVFDEDIFCDTYMKVYDKIIKDGIKDDSDKGFDSYTFMAFKINTIRNKQYARIKKRDGNIININKANEKYQNSKLSHKEKLTNDLRKDFFTLYLMNKVEENFDEEHFYLFKLKTFLNITYADLAKKTGIKSVRQKIIDVRNWLKTNVKKEDVEKEFDEIYGEIL